MLNYTERLSNIERDVYTNMDKASQKTIDFVQETKAEIDDTISDNGRITSDDLQAISYEIGILLEIWNKELHYDISILSAIDKIVNEWSEYISKLANNSHNHNIKK